MYVHITLLEEFNNRDVNFVSSLALSSHLTRNEDRESSYNEDVERLIRHTMT